jgi:hypothetical protein
MLEQQRFPRLFPVATPTVGRLPCPVELAHVRVLMAIRAAGLEANPDSLSGSVGSLAVVATPALDLGVSSLERDPGQRMIESNSSPTLHGMTTLTAIRLHEPEQPPLMYVLMAVFTSGRFEAKRRNRLAGGFVEQDRRPTRPRAVTRAAGNRPMCSS